MIFSGTRQARVRRLLAGVRWSGAIIAALALAALVAIGPPGTAKAASGNNYNQITGVGTTASAVTVDWTQGLLNSSNQPISAPGSELNPNSDRSSETGSLSFMDNDFKNLQVTVGETQNITHQSITVTWKGVPRTQVAGNGTAQNSFMQIMECYGDSSTGPSPEDCEFGSQGMLPNGAANAQIGTRTGDLCPAGSQPDPANPPGPQVANLPGDAGCDTFEPTSENPPHCWPNAPAGEGCSDGLFDIPFVPVDDQSPPIYDPESLGTYFESADTNEVQQGITGVNDTGQVQFQAVTEVQSQGLGCGEQDNGQPRGCWLVIVPRGGYEPNGFNVSQFDGGISESPLYTSPLSAANWAQRIQIHLDYAPLQVSCSNNPPVYSIEGTQLITKAVSSWQLALNKQANCSLIYQYGEQIETQTTSDLSTGAVGMGFTTIPIGSEDSRYPGEPPPPKLPPILYAPVAVTGIGFGFNINDGPGFTTTAVNLTPSLTAKALTQVYLTDLPDYGASDKSAPGPAWAQKNPSNITDDPAFQKINSPTVIKPFTTSSDPIEPLTTLDHSAVNQQLWQWIQSDPATASWLDGTDPSNPVTADPDYVKLHPGKPPADDDFPQDYAGTATCASAKLVGCGQNGDVALTTQDLLPQFFDFDSAASDVLAANDKSFTLSSWSSANQDPSNGLAGYWAAAGTEPPGQTFMWTLADLPDNAHYGLVDANLCAPSGTSCVGPSVASITKTLDSAKADSKGLLEVNPAKIPAGGYPLVDVVYAAVPTNQKAVDLTTYANFIKYGVTQGQTTGSALGDLPPGYLPLPQSLENDALNVVAKLLALANPKPSHSPSPTHTPTSPQSGGPTQSTSTTASPTSPGTGTPTSGTSPAPTVGASATPTSTSRAGLTATSSPSQQGPVVLQPTAELAGGTTPRQSPGGIRWALIAVLIIGAAGALGGTVLRSGRMPRWRIRGRPSAR
jgi:hypothetical protein